MVGVVDGTGVTQGLTVVVVVVVEGAVVVDVTGDNYKSVTTDQKEYPVYEPPPTLSNNA